MNQYCLKFCESILRQFHANPSLVSIKYAVNGHSQHKSKSSSSPDMKGQGLAFNHNALSFLSCPLCKKARFLATNSCQNHPAPPTRPSLQLMRLTHPQLRASLDCWVLWMRVVGVVRFAFACSRFAFFHGRGGDKRRLRVSQYFDDLSECQAGCHPRGEEKLGEADQLDEMQEWEDACRRRSAGRNGGGPGGKGIAS